jgi:hypothetical protein
VIGRLVLGVVVDPTPELADRAARLREYRDEHTPGGYVVGDGLEGGRAATEEDVERLAWDGHGLPPGLHPCPVCEEPAGEFLAVRGEGNGDRRPRVIDVLSRCRNENRCAACGGLLHERALSAYYWDGSARPGVRYAAAYVAFSHDCPAVPPGSPRSEEMPMTR